MPLPNLETTLVIRRPLVLALLLSVAAAVPLPQDAPIRGFSPEAARTQRAWEERFQAIPDPDSLRAWMHRLAAEPQFLGSAYGLDNSRWLVEKFRSWGWEAELNEYRVLFPTPRERVLELVAPTRFRATLREPALPGDPYTGRQAEHLPSYNVYSVDGDVTAPLVFVNYGLPEDYAQLERMGVSVRGAIVLAKYGRSWRGIKPKLAAERGAVATLIYSDPADDGYALGLPYPDGPMRPEQGVQRGSVMELPVRPGDPLTPYVGSTPGAPRLPLDSVETFVRIPVLPISWGEARPLLAALGGRPAPAAWQGGLPLTYRVGPGPARVRLRLAFNWEQVTLYNVIARLPGTDAGEEWVVRGNHRDGWGNGAADPVSGMIALMEEARALGALYRQGWRPRRTLVYAAWDGEEQGLLGSTEWAEDHREDLQRRAVAYVNTDGNGRGFLSMGGSHSLQRFLNEVARVVPDPETGLSVWERLRRRTIAQATGALRAEARSGADLRLDALGSGSDWTPFLQHLGIASVHLGFGGEGASGSYHSIYDTPAHFERFVDGSHAYGRALAQVAGIAVMRLASAELLPFQFTAQAETFQGYAGEIRTLHAERRDQIEETNRQLAEGVFAATSDPLAPLAAPAAAEPPPALNFAPLENGVAALRRAAARLEAAWPSSGGPAVAPVNALLRRAERALTDAEGLPRRPWYRHLVYAPGYYTGYGVKTLPGVREALEQGDWAEAEREAERAGHRFQAAAAVVDSAAAALERLRR